MRDKFIHVNSQNEIIDFLSLGIYANSNELRDFEWTVNSNDNVITSMTRGIVKKTIPFLFYCNEKRANEIKNMFYEHFEIDVLTKQKGYFEINGYRYYCYLTRSKKSDYLYSKRQLRLSVEITTDKGYWIKEKEYVLNVFESERAISNAKKYAYSYPYSYSGQKGLINIQNDSIDECDAIIRMFGPATNPFIKIGDVVYQVNAIIDKNEYFEINTEERTVFKISNFGTKTNAFMYRSNSRANFFLKIPSGALRVSWNGSFKGDITLIEKRSEPKWI